MSEENATAARRQRKVRQPKSGVTKLIDFMLKDPCVPTISINYLLISILI